MYLFGAIVRIRAELILSKHMLQGLHLQNYYFQTHVEMTSSTELLKHLTADKIYAADSTCSCEDDYW